MPTLAEYLTSHPFELVLSSGFFGFFAHTGVVLALEEAGLRPQLLGGSSAGALVAGLWGAGLPATDLRSELLSLSRASFWDVDPLWGLPFYLREGRLRRLAELLGVGRLADESSGPEEFIDCPTKVRVAAFDLGTLRTEVLEDGDLALAIRASCCFPGMFQPVRIGDRRYLDGGIADRPGISTATPGARLLFHHLPAHSPWRKVVRLQNDVPAWPELHLLHEPSLPKLSPFRLTPGPQALQLAYEMTKRRLNEPVSR